MAVMFCTLKYIQYRAFNTTCNLQNKPAKFMNKIMKGSIKRKAPYRDNQTLPKSLLNEGRSGNSKRGFVLNKLFMKHITDLMATGENASVFLGHGIEINRVQITSDYKQLNIFYVAKNDSAGKITENILKKSAGFLRHELSTLRLMGEIPIIQFVKDKKYTQLVELDTRLTQADFGESYECTEQESKIKTKLKLITNLPTNLKEEILKLEEKNINLEESFPHMPQNVLGLNHINIFNRVVQALKKSPVVSNVHNPQVQTNEHLVEYSSNSKQNLAFKEFLQRRELLRSKVKQDKKDSISDLEYIKQEYELQQNAFFDKMSPEEYLEEEEELK